MKRLRQPPIVVALLVAAVLLVSIFSQVALGNEPKEELPAPHPHITFTMDEVATNEAGVNAIDTAETQDMEDARRGLFGTVVPKDEYVTPVIPATETLPPGIVGEIIDRVVGLAGDGEYKWSNGWGGVMDGHNIFIAAGALAPYGEEKSSPQGLIRIGGDSSDLNGLYFAPKPEGALKIVSVKESCINLTIVDTDKSLQFDLYKRVWSCSEK